MTINLVRLRWEGVIALCVLNFLDILVTRLDLRLGAHEGNPIMHPFAASWWGVGIKLFLPALIGYAILHGPLTRFVVIRLWIVVGIYSAVVLWGVHVANVYS